MSMDINNFISYTLMIFCVVASVCGTLQEGKRLIAFSEQNKEWLTVAEVEKLIVDKQNFIDVTDHQVPVVAHVTLDPIPTQAQHKIYVNELLETISAAQLQTNLNFLTTFNTRYYTSTTGADAAKWLYSQFETIIGKSDERNLTVESFAHTWLQPSVIATIPGWGPNKEQVVVIGAHEDSVGSSTTGRAPGADDDGTGTVTVLEIFRVLVGANYHPDRTLKFMLYAGEEAGLRGSQVIAAKYATDATVVHAVLQLDMTGWGGNEEIGVVGDFVNKDVTDFVKILIDTYSLLDWTDTLCGYGCSDHASWTRSGFRSAFPFEAVFSNSNPYIHSTQDLVSHLSFDRIVEFTKLGVGFAVELAGTTIQP